MFYDISVILFGISVLITLSEAKNTSLPSSPSSHWDLWTPFEITSDFEKGIPLHQVKHFDIAKANQEANRFVKGNVEKSPQVLDHYLKNSVSQQNVSDGQELFTEGMFKVSRNFMQGKPEIKTRLPYSESKLFISPHNKTSIKPKYNSMNGIKQSISFDFKKWKPKTNLTIKPSNNSGAINRRNDGTLGSRIITMKKNIIKKAVEKRKTFSSSLLSQASYLSPATVFGPSFDANGQLVAAPPTPIAVLASPQQPVSFSTGLVQSPPQTFNLAAPTFSAVPVQSPTSMVAPQSIGFFQAAPMQQFSPPSTTSQQIALQSPQFSTVAITPIASANVASAPTFQTVPVAAIQNSPIVQAAIPVQVQQTNTVAVQRSPQFETGIKPMVLASPPLMSSVSYSPIPVGRSITIRSPLGFQSKTQRTTSYYNPPVPQRSRTVYTQSQMMPTHTTVYTTTHFSPATRTTVLETDHYPVYSSQVVGETTKVASKYASSLPYYK